MESIAGPSDIIPDSVMSIGTEDESYGGVWRALFEGVESKSNADSKSNNEDCPASRPVLPMESGSVDTSSLSNGC